MCYTRVYIAIIDYNLQSVITNNMTQKILHTTYTSFYHQPYSYKIKNVTL